MNWIWLNDIDPKEKNTFAEFSQCFDYKSGEAVLSISADYRYAAYIGDTMVSCGQYADLPWAKSVNQATITPFLKIGANTLRVVAWHMGTDHSVCRTMPASVAFEIKAANEVIAASGEKTLCRKAPGYLAGDLISPQLGSGFHYDFTASADVWKHATVVASGFTEIPRPIKQTTVGDLCVSTVVAQGAFQYNGGETAAEKMQNAWLSTLRFRKMTGIKDPTARTLASPIHFENEAGNGLFVVVDAGRETCGYLGFSVAVDTDCTALLGWGEHLTDLRVRTRIGHRNFGMRIALKKGENPLDDYLMRIGCRYICLFVEAPSFTLSSLGIREVGYPFSFPKKDFGDSLLNAIYETGRRTLYLSAHEHYEDCPWREQGLYGMDSRNQMLFGYGAFGEYDYPRANLMLINNAMQSDGLIPITAPAKSDITIPSFTAYWLIAIGENIAADYNEAFVRAILPKADTSLAALLKQEGPNGLSLFTKTPYWNFHEWSTGLDGGRITRDYELEPEDDGALTALTAIAAKKVAFLHSKVSNNERAAELLTVSNRLIASLEAYYDEEKGLYASYIKNEEKRGYHEFTQALILCTGGVPEARVAKLIQALKAPADHGLVPLTLAALQFKYEALIKYGNELSFCIEDIKRIFGSMLLRDATSYFETEVGEADFDDAGSLCHGWSAVPCWVMDQYLKV